MPVFKPLAAITLALATLNMPSASAQDHNSQPRTLAVNASATASGKPDRATLSIGVETQGDTAAAALGKNAEAMKATLAEIDKFGIPRKNIQTSNVNISPLRDYEQNRSNPPVIGYRASNSATVKIDDIDRLGEIMDATVGAGANSLNGLTFSRKDMSPLENEARTSAVRRARERAKILADAAGVSLGPILAIEDGAAVAAPRPGRMMVTAARMESDGATTPIEAGETTAQANVTLVYRID